MLGFQDSSMRGATNVRVLLLMCVCLSVCLRLAGSKPDRTSPNSHRLSQTGFLSDGETDVSQKEEEGEPNRNCRTLLELEVELEGSRLTVTVPARLMSHPLQRRGTEGGWL